MLSTLHTVLLVGFVGVTALLLAMTVLHRVRMPRVVLSWHTGRLGGLPLAPALFLLAVLAFFAYGLYASTDVSPALLAGYGLGGAFWFASALLSSAVLVTDHGVLRPSRRCMQAVAWSQVVDYFEREAQNRRRFVFFYLDEAGHRERLELLVPAAQCERFRQVVYVKLDARFDYATQQAYGKKELEG